MKFLVQLLVPYIVPLIFVGIVVGWLVLFKLINRREERKGNLPPFDL
jgi:hypothetical protein